jgi:uncharacterized protein YaeQ
MSARYSFELQSGNGRRPLPNKIVLGQRYDESTDEVLLKLLGFLLLFRDRLQIEPRLHDQDIPFVPHLLQLDFQLHPALWAECGECDAKRLNKLAVKAPDAELWILRESPAAAEDVYRLMEKHKLRRNRYNIVGFDEEMFAELRDRLSPRNQIFWVTGEFEPPSIQFDFNELWFEAPFTHLKF